MTAQPETRALSICTCYWVDPKYWTTHYGAVEPGSTMEPNPDCPEHFPQTRIEWCGTLRVDQPIKETPVSEEFKVIDQHDDDVCEEAHRNNEARWRSAGIQPDSYVPPPAPPMQSGGIGSSRGELFQLMLGRTTLKAVERILAAGYRKPRTITTVEELDALPAESVVLSATSHVYQHESEEDVTWWAHPGDQRVYASRQVRLPATVLYEPEAQS